MKVTITTLTNSFILNNVQFQKGSLAINTNALPLVQIGNYNTTVADITADGQTFANAQAFQDWAANTKMFASKGGGGGGGNVDSVTGNLVSGTTANPVVSLSGTPMDIVTFDEDGNPEVKPIGITQLTDINGFPSFANGVFVATGMNAVSKTGLLLFLEFSAAVKNSTFPIRDGSGRLKVADGVANDDAVSKGQLDATKATILPNNAKVVYFGDSITAYGQNSGNPYFDSWGFTTWHNFYTGGRLLLPLNGNKGVGGNTTVQMIARMGAALALAPNVTTIIAGTNDIAILGSPAVDIISRLKRIVDGFVSVNSIVVLGTILPRYGSSALTAPQETIRQTVNTAILEMGVAGKVYVVNNETTMNNANLYQSDGLHPNTRGAQILGQNMATPLLPLLNPATITKNIFQDNALTTNIDLTGTTGTLNGATGQVATSYTLNASQSSGATVVGSKTVAEGANQQVITISGTKTATVGEPKIQFGTGGFATALLTTGSISNSFLDFEVLTTLTNVKMIGISTTYNGASGYLQDSYSYFPIDSSLPVLPIGRYQMRGYNFVAPAGVTNVDMFVVIFLQTGAVAVSGSIKIWKAAVLKVS